MGAAVEQDANRDDLLAQIPKLAWEPCEKLWREAANIPLAATATTPSCPRLPPPNTARHPSSANHFHPHCQRHHPHHPPACESR